MSKFQALVDKLKRKGEPAREATFVAAKVGREKYGAQGMAEKAAASRAREGK